MKKIPTLFIREFIDHKVVKILPEVTPGCEWVLEGKGTATVKIDGACCAVMDGILYKRYDAKTGKDGKPKAPPEGAIPCGNPDPVTGHWPHWVKTSRTDPADRWFREAFTFCGGIWLPDGTYEAIGPHFNNNPYRLKQDILLRHGENHIFLPDRSFEGIRDYLRDHPIEGIVFWKDGRPQCKIKRRDFGFAWPCSDEISDVRSQTLGQIEENK